MTITAERARELLYAAHDAWNKRDIERLLSLCVDDMTYWSSVGGIEGMSVPNHFRFADGLGRASVEFYVHVPKSGHKHTGTFRQIVSYRDNKISRLEEYHDASALQAFCELVTRK